MKNLKYQRLRTLLGPVSISVVMIISILFLPHSKQITHSNYFHPLKISIRLILKTVKQNAKMVTPMMTGNTKKAKENNNILANTTIRNLKMNNIFKKYFVRSIYFH